jgi:hypothetical protein
VAVFAIGQIGIQVDILARTVADMAFPLVEDTSKDAIGTALHYLHYTPRQCQDALVGQADVRRKLIEFEQAGMRPGNGAGFVGEAGIIGFGMETEHHVMVQVEGFILMRRDAVNVEAGEHPGLISHRGSRLFDYFAASGMPELVILLTHVAAG